MSQQKKYNQRWRPITLTLTPLGALWVSKKNNLTGVDTPYIAMISRSPAVLYIGAYYAFCVVVTYT